MAARPAGGSFGAPVTLQGSISGGTVVAAGGSGRALAAFSLAPGVIRAATGGLGGFGGPETISPAVSIRPEVGQDAQGHGVAAWLRDGFVEAALYDPVAPVLQNFQAPATGRPGQVLDFSVGANDAFTSIASIGWNFGDGTGATGGSAKHAYAKPGTYTAIATATDAAGNRRSQSRQVVVSSPVTPDSTGPRLRLRLPRRVSLRALLRGITVRVNCNEACRARVDLLIDRRLAKRLRLAATTRIGRKSKSISRAGTMRIRVRPSAKARRRLRRSRLGRSRLRRVRVRVTAADRAGNRARAVSRRLSIR